MVNLVYQIVFKIYSLSYKLRGRIIKNQRIDYWTNITKKRLTKLPPVCNNLTDEEKQEIESYYKPYVEVKINPLFHEFYKRATGKFDVRIIPDDIYYSRIDPYFNDWEYAATMDNKTFYSWMFRNVRQPKIICTRQNGFWYGSEGQIMSVASAVDEIKSFPISFIKNALTT